MSTRLTILAGKDACVMTESLKHHSIIVENRKKIVMAGIKDVESFNDTDMVIITHSGALRVKGKNLEISRISVEDGDLEMTGEVTSIHYSDADRTPNNIITKLFR